MTLPEFSARKEGGMLIVDMTCGDIWKRRAIPLEGAERRLKSYQAGLIAATNRDWARILKEQEQELLSRVRAVL